MTNIDKYIAEIQTQINGAYADLYRLEGALAMLEKIKADMEQEKAEKNGETSSK